MSQLSGKKILVTGGSRGFGRGMVEALAAEGAKVWAVARSAEHLDLLKQELNSVQTCAADIGVAEVVPQLLRDIWG